MSLATVKELRAKTGAGVLDCRRALAEAGGDEQRALKILRERGLAQAARRSSRATTEGAVGARVGSGGRVAAVLELDCETDFVANTDEFRSLLGRLLEQTLVEGKPQEAEVQEVATRLREHLVLRRYERLEAGNGAWFSAYVHGPGKIAVVVEIAGPAGAAGEALGKDLAMQVAAAVPRYVRREEIPETELAAERDIYRVQAEQSGKPPKVIERIVAGKLEKFYRDVCLLEQPFIRDPERTVAERVAAAGAEAGADYAVRRFVRFQVGERGDGGSG